jgi:hypothetical protein
VEAMYLRSVRILGNLVQKAGPYLLLEILLPGGTLFALLLFVYRRREDLVIPHARRVAEALVRAATGVRELLAFADLPFGIAASVWRGRHRERDGLEALGVAP